MGEHLPTRRENGRLEKFEAQLQGEKMVAELAKACGDPRFATKQARFAMTYMKKNPDILRCTPVSVYQAVMQATQYGLLIDDVIGEAYLVKFGNECVFMPGYRGLVKKMVEEGGATSVPAELICENDHFVHEHGSDSRIEHTWKLGEDRGKTIGAYAIAHMKEGPDVFVVMSTEQIDKIRAGAPGKNSPAWTKHWDAMAKKTCVRQLPKQVPMSPNVTALAMRDEYYEAQVGQFAPPLALSDGVQSVGSKRRKELAEEGPPAPSGPPPAPPKPSAERGGADAPSGQSSPPPPPSGEKSPFDELCERENAKRQRPAPSVNPADVLMPPSQRKGGGKYTGERLGDILDKDLPYFKSAVVRESMKKHHPQVYAAGKLLLDAREDEDGGPPSHEQFAEDVQKTYDDNYTPGEGPGWTEEELGAAFPREEPEA